jgi:hypothetical protein
MLTDGFCSFPVFFQTNVTIIIKLGHGHFLPRTFQSIIRILSLTPYNLNN